MTTTPTGGSSDPAPAEGRAEGASGRTVPASRRRPTGMRLLRDVFIVFGLAFVALRLLGVQPWTDAAVDTWAYWSTRSGDLYASHAVGTVGSYLYSPAFAQLLIPFTWLPWPLFAGAWTAMLVAAYGYLARDWSLPLLVFLPIPFEIVSGNVHLLIALAIVVGFRYPAAWAFILLTKVTPGIGLIWFAVRREWRSLAIALAATAAVSAVSFVLAPGEWSTWIRTLTDNAGGPVSTPGWYLPVPLLVRLPLAAVLVAWGGLTDRRWTVALAVTLALPLVWLNGLAILVAVVPDLRARGISLRPLATRRAVA